MTKERLQEIVAGLPGEFHVDDVIRSILLNEQVDKAIGDYKAGNYFTSEDVAEKIEEMKRRHRRNAA
jgi:hypothetical protein